MWLMVEAKPLNTLQKEILMYEYMFYHDMVQQDVPCARQTFKYRIQMRLFKTFNVKWQQHHVTVTEYKRLPPIKEDYVMFAGATSIAFTFGSFVT